MIVMNVVLDNLYGFKDFSVDFSYPKKLVNSPLIGEYLPDYPSFKYKKVNIIMGGNATGKTTFGKALMGIFNFITKKDPTAITERISDKTKTATFCIDFIPLRNTLWRVETIINAPDESGHYKASDFRVLVKNTAIKQKDNYERCRMRLDAIPSEYGSYINLFDNIEQFGWYLTFPNEGATTIKAHTKDSDLFERTLDAIMRTLDPAIKRVQKSTEIEDAYIIKHAAFEAVIRDGRLLEGSEELSTGTINGIDIALLLSAIMSHQYGWYYCDEKYSYIQSDLERYLLATMIEKLGPYEQFFFTTHNSDILKLNLPHHSFLFLKKENDIITPLFASHYLKRNTDNLYAAVENDRFSIKPDMILLDEFDYPSKETTRDESTG